MLLYAVLSSVLVLFFTGNIADRLRTRIRSGDISLDLVRPVYLPALWLAEGVGGTLAILLIEGVPLLLGAWFLIGSIAPHSCVTFLLFLPAAWLSYLIIWLMGSIVSLVAFWALELGSIVHAQDAAVRFLSGSIVPVWFFPASVQAVLAWTPFIYTYQGTIGIYLGRYSPAEAVRIIAIQAVWVFLLGGIFVTLWHQARRKVIVQGG
jgi:ABC-2 type transport system permease protein